MKTPLYLREKILKQGGSMSENQNASTQTGQKMSFSRIKMYEECPRKYWYRYVDEYTGRGLPNEMMAEGNEQHAAIQTAIETGNLNAVPGKLKPIVEKFFNDPVIEDEIEFFLYSGQPLIGYVDVHSYEPDKRMISILDIKLFVEPKDDTQLKIYALGLRNKYPDVLAYRGWYYMAGLDYYRPFLFYDDDLDNFEEELNRKVDTLLAEEEFELNPGTHCHTCPYVHKCEAAQTYEIEPIQTMEEAQLLMERVHIADGFVKQYREHLKTFMEENGLAEVPFNDENGEENYRAYFSSFVSLKFGKAKKKKGKQ